MNKAETIELKGYHCAGDGGGGTYYWDSTVEDSRVTMHWFNEKTGKFLQQEIKEKAILAIQSQPYFKDKDNG